MGWDHELEERHQLDAGNQRNTHTHTAKIHTYAETMQSWQTECLGIVLELVGGEVA